MKKTKSINSAISSIVSDLGHTDRICISDAGLPVPDEVLKIDLAIKLGLPSFKDVLEVIESEAKFEKVFIAKEIEDHFPNFVKMIKSILGEECEVKLIPHTQFKEMTNTTKAIFRTGENKWFHNIILQSGVTF